MDTINIARYEYKYLIQPAQLPEIRRFIAPHTVADPYTPPGEWYGIKTLYLDTPNYFLYQLHERKCEQRIKVRVRGYTAAGSPVKLEVKRRLGDLVVKDSHLNDAGPECEFTRVRAQFGADPRMLIHYERLAFTAANGEYVRVTVDRNIQYQPMSAWDLDGEGRGWRKLPSKLLLELKYRDTPPVWIDELIARFQLQRCGFSKYGRSVRSLRDARQAPATSPSFVPTLPFAPISSEGLYG